MTHPTDPKDALRALLETYLRCPVQPVLTELEQGLRAYQTEWIRARAGGDAPPLADPAKAAIPKAKFKVDAPDRAVLERIAEGWVPTTAEVPRWAWLEDRELVKLEPNPAGSGPEVLRMADEGWRAIGRNPPG
ncbi:MAG TPA: hypothetical protein VD860_13690 [Azospirillum sp.]|nr:hypothetical protein [Azospirillum sp.]